MLQDVPTILGGRYRVVERLGRGGMADVYRAEDVVLRRTVAIKIFRGGVEREAHLARFRTEVKTLAALTHPHLVALYDAGGDVSEPWCAMEYVNGGSLSDREGTMPPAAAARLGEQIGSALGYVHGRGIVHRDVKPSNVLLDRDGGAFLSDFGIARLVDGTRMTQSGFMIGTAAFLSPEQVRGLPAGPAADVYALGLVLLEALTGEREYPGTAVESAVARLSRPPRLPDRFGSGWTALLSAMTAEQASDRPDADSITRCLRALAEGAVLTGPILAGLGQARIPDPVAPDLDDAALGTDAALRTDADSATAAAGHPADDPAHDRADDRADDEAAGSGATSSAMPAAAVERARPPDTPAGTTEGTGSMDPAVPPGDAHPVEAGADAAEGNGAPEGDGPDVLTPVDSGPQTGTGPDPVPPPTPSTGDHPLPGGEQPRIWRIPLPWRGVLVAGAAGLMVVSGLVAVLMIGTALSSPPGRSRAVSSSPSTVDPTSTGVAAGEPLEGRVLPVGPLPAPVQDTSTVRPYVPLEVPRPAVVVAPATSRRPATSRTSIKSPSPSASHSPTPTLTPTPSVSPTTSSVSPTLSTSTSQTTAPTTSSPPGSISTSPVTGSTTSTPTVSRPSSSTSPL